MRAYEKVGCAVALAATLTAGYLEWQDYRARQARRAEEPANIIEGLRMINKALDDLTKTAEGGLRPYPTQENK